MVQYISKPLITDQSTLELKVKTTFEHFWAEFLLVFNLAHVEVTFSTQLMLFFSRGESLEV